MSNSELDREAVDSTALPLEEGESVIDGESRLIAGRAVDLIESEGELKWKERVYKVEMPGFRRFELKDARGKIICALCFGVNVSGSAPEEEIIVAGQGRDGKYCDINSLGGLRTFFDINNIPDSVRGQYQKIKGLLPATPE